MIEYIATAEKGEISCDTCGETEEFDAVDFQQLVEKARALGWQTFKAAGSWEHYCPACRD